MGKWLKVNGEAIYGAGRTPFGKEFGSYDPVKKNKKGKAVFNTMDEWRCTTQPGKLYFHLLKWPVGKFDVRGVNSRVAKAYLLADPARKPLRLSQNEETLAVELPTTAPDKITSVLCVELCP